MAFLGYAPLLRLLVDTAAVACLGLALFTSIHRGEGRDSIKMNSVTASVAREYDELRVFGFSSVE